jgi:GntR family transcriptional regulator
VSDSILNKIAKPDDSLSLPLHAQASAILRDFLRQMREGETFPDEVSLARHWNISRNTVRAAIAPLVSEGLLERRSGIGTRVRVDRHSSGIAAWSSFTQEMQRRGIAVETFSSEWQTGSSPLAAKMLQIRGNVKLLSLRRVRGWNKIPAVLFQSYFHPRLQLSANSGLAVPLYEWIFTVSGVRADRSVDEFAAVAADASTARLLKVRVGVPLLQRNRVVLDAKGMPMEFAVVLYRSDRFTLSLSLAREEW